jgi:hypothetical protein
MIAQGNLAADPVFLDALERVEDAASRFARTLQQAPRGWKRAERGGWVHLQPEQARLPAAGWKIHVSATAGDAPRAVDEVWEYCVERGIAFKFLRSGTVLAHLNSKQGARSSSGKLITIYPLDQRQLRRTLTELGRLLKGITGPYILTDLRWDDGPLYIRYGGFALNYCFSPDGDYVPALARPDGTLAPDVRGTSFKVPSWVQVPDFIADRIRTTPAAAGGGFPYRVEKALHFSNSGGVYRAVERGCGRTVVLREARPHAGLDRHGVDAVTRLEHEHRMLLRLSGLDCVPEVYARTRHWEHHFLVEEYVEGETLYEEVAQRHPLFRSLHTEADLTAYTRWACGVLDRVEAAMSALHRRGIVFADLKLDNVLVRPDDSVCLVDFETAFEADDGTVPSMASPGFSAPWPLSGVAVDDYALACLRLAVFLPLTPLLRFDERKHEQLIEVVERRFPVPQDFGARLRAALKPPAEAALPSLSASLTSPASPADDPEKVLDSMRDAIVASATPDRDDRLFPGDVRQFEYQGASVAYGAAGVLHALRVTGRDDHPEFGEHVEWLVRAVERTRWPRPGLYDGLAGIAYVLRELGRHAEAGEALARLDAFDLRDCGTGLFGGLAGIALTHLHFGDVDRAVELGEHAARRLADGRDLAKAGLMDGWSGPALLFTRLYAETGETRHRRRAQTALARDIGRCRVLRGQHLHVKDGTRRIATLGQGSTGIGIALHEYLRHAEDPHFSRLLHRIRNGLGTELVVSAGLFDGRAGLLYGLTHLGGSDTARSAHLEALRLHAVPYQGHLAFPVTGLVRLSMDLATGTAGVLLAVHTALRAEVGHQPLPLLDTTGHPLLPVPNTTGHGLLPSLDTSG